MIYLIKGVGYGSRGIEEHLKIGYSSDGKSRFDTYKTHNPTCSVLYQVPLWSEKLEKKIHKFFKHLEHVGDMEEWYIYSKKIINFFKRFKDEKETDVETYIDEILKIRSYGYSLDGDDIDFLKKYWFDCNTKQERLKYLYEVAHGISCNDYDQLEDDVRFYYESVKKSIAEELKYDLGLIRKESLKNNETFIELLDETFEVGEIYSEDKINQFLKNCRILPDLELSDLCSILEIKDINIPGETKKYYKIWQKF